MAVVVDIANVKSSATNAFLGGSYSVTMSVTCASSDNILVVPIVSGSPSTTTFTSVLYNGVALSLLAGSVTTIAGPANLTTAIYYLLNPPTGAAHALNIIWTTGGTDGGTACAIPMSGVNTSSPFGTPVLAGLTTNNIAAMTVTGAGPNDYYVAAAINGIQTMTASGANQTNLASLTNNGNESFSFDTVPGVDAGAFSWTGSGTQWGNGWAAVGVAVTAPSVAPPSGGPYFLESTEYF